jgi:O-acetyl-ADP-ribose deacetylase (regulator of RNase III)
MKWQLYHGDILDIPADILVCSSNVYLALSGGVGGAFLQRYGPAMQDALDHYLSAASVRHVPRGTIVEMPPCGSPYRAVFHAVAVDAMYESSPAIVATVMAESLRRAAALKAKSVALSAFATGYGRMTMREFAEALKSITEQSFQPVERVMIGLRSENDVEELEELVANTTLEVAQQGDIKS